jgi:hypothetical protein
MMLERNKEAVTDNWRNMNNELCHDVHTSPNAIRVMESRRMR